MKGLAVSNIAWTAEEESAALPMLAAAGVTGLELAPTVAYPEWKGCDEAAGRRDRERFAEAGFEVCALQAILYGKSDLQVFDPRTHDAFLKHLEAVCGYARGVGAPVLVFGSPKNRKRGQLGMREACEKGAPFLRRVGDVCADFGCIFGWEHNPIEYSCDFVTSLRDAEEWIRQVDHPAVRVHADAGGLMMAGGPLPDGSLESADPAHFHVSAPNLAPVAAHADQYRMYLKVLTVTGYDGWISIEMKRPEGGLQEVESSVLAIQRVINELAPTGA